MSFNLTGGNPRAHRIRVYLFGTTTILEGMPVCYDDSTTNWHGGSMAATGEVTESTTTAEGSLNEGRYIRVEIPNADNVGMFAGVVASGSPGIGKAGPCAIDIYVPNGAIVPVLTDLNCIADQTILAIQSGEEELGVPIAGDCRPVAIARETYDWGDTGLVLAELCPERFMYQDMGGTALSMGAGTDNVIGNHINLTYAGTAGGSEGMRIMLHDTGVRAAGGGVCALLAYATVTGSVTTGTNYVRTILGQLVLDGCTCTEAASIYTGGHFQIGGAPATMICGVACALWADYGLTTLVTGTSTVLRLSNNSATAIGSMMELHGATCDALMEISNATTGAHHFVDKCLGSMTVDANDQAIGISIDGATYYLIAVDSIPAG